MTPRLPLLLLAGGLTVALAACSATASPASPTATSAPSTVAYDGSEFAIPFTAYVPADAGTAAVDYGGHLIDWVSPKADDHVIRFVAPVVYYAPNEPQSAPVPDDYLAYLKSLTDHGVTFTDTGTIPIDGHSASIMTVHVADGAALNGTIGCPTADTAGPDDNCFGFQSRLDMRFVALDLGNKVFVAWARTNKGASDEQALFTKFETMLSTVKLSS